MKYFKTLCILLVVLSFSSPAFSIFGSNKKKREYKRIVNTSLSENADNIDQSKSADTQLNATDFSGNAAASDSDLTGKLSMIAGVAAVGYGLSKVPKCLKMSASACAQMALALAQAGSMFGQGGSALKTRDDLCGSCDWNGGSGVNLNDLDDGGSGLNESLKSAIDGGNLEGYLDTATLAQVEIDKAFAAIEAQGFDVDKETGAVFDSNGNKVSAGANGGVPQSLTDKIAKTIDAVKEDHSKANGGGSLNASNSGASGQSVLYEDDFGARGPASKKDEGKKKDDFLAGLSDSSKGGIGVAGDDIFKMMTRRYTKKIKSREFILKK